ncbi:hypothetical protein [Magnetospirillum moscoviense]|nr:hypothetical protein [Magnetospirillum moscoviense]
MMTRALARAMAERAAEAPPDKEPDEAYPKNLSNTRPTPSK